MRLRGLVITTAYPLKAYPRLPVAPWLWRIYREIQKRGVEIEVLAAAYRGISREAGAPFRVHLYRYAPAPLETLTHEAAMYDILRKRPWKASLLPFFLLGGLAKAMSLSRDHPYHWIHVHWPFPFVLLALPFHRVPWILTFHGSDWALLARLNPAVRDLFLGLFRKARVLTVNSGFLRQRLLDTFEKLPPIEVLPMPPALEIPPPERWPPRDPYRVLFVGRLISLKGGDVLLRAFQAVLQKIPQAHLVMIGGGPEEEAWRALARELRIERAVHFRGNLPPQALADEYPRAAIVAVPSRTLATGQTETLGVVAIEAQAFGTPVVASRTGGLPEVVRHGETGLLVPENDPEALAHAILKLLKDPALREEMGRKAREHYLRNFSPESTGQRLYALYQRVALSP